MSDDASDQSSVLRSVIAAAPPKSGEGLSLEWKEILRKDSLVRDAFDALLVALRPDNICDIGCFNCDESARFQRLQPDAKLFAFEAKEQNIREFISQRTDIGNVVVINAAVSDKDGEVMFNVLKMPPDAELWRRSASSLKLRNDDLPYDAVPVRSIRLDTYFEKSVEAGETFALWIDVEGALELVLNGAANVLSRTLLIRCEVERREYWRNQLTAEYFYSFFGELGFNIIADTWSRGVFDQSDILLFNKNWLQLAQNSRRNLSRVT